MLAFPHSSEDFVANPLIVCIIHTHRWILAATTLHGQKSNKESLSDVHWNGCGYYGKKTDVAGLPLLWFCGFIAVSAQSIYMHVCHVPTQHFLLSSIPPICSVRQASKFACLFSHYTLAVLFVFLFKSTAVIKKKDSSELKKYMKSMKVTSLCQ